MWTRVRLAVDDPAAAQDVAMDLWTIGARGWEMRDGETFSELEGAEFRGADTGRLRGRPESVEIIAYFATRAGPPDLESLLGRHACLRLLAVHQLEDEAWRDSWRQFFTPTRVSRRIGVRPSWNDLMPEGLMPEGTTPGDHGVILVIDPGMAFGTGTHETTRMCLELIDQHLDGQNDDGPGVTVLDVGSGSGILTMAAHRLGARRCLGVDNDPEALRVARENWVLNGLGEAPGLGAPFALTPLSEVEPGWDLVVANILSGILLELRHELVRVTAPGGTLLISGVLAEERDRFVDAFVGAPDEASPVALLDEHRDGEWIALRLRRR